MKKRSLYIGFVTLVATLGGLLFGYDTAVISGTVSSLEAFFIEPLGLSELMANSSLGLLVSSALIGCILGGLSGGWISRVIGRKRGLQLAAVLFMISALGSAMPEVFFAKVGSGDHSYMYHFMTYRIIGGIGVGLASILSPLYISEIAPAEQRGKLVSWNQFAIIFGMLVVYFVNYSIAKGGDDQWLHNIGWRWMFASEALPAGLFLLLLTPLPETPRYLALKNKNEKAFQILSRVNGGQKGKEILDDIKASLIEKSNKLNAYGYWVLIIGLLLAMFQQFVGINVVLYYAPEIFRNMGSTTDTALLQTIIVGIINLSFTVLAILSVDRFGRKRLQIIGGLGMGFFMLALGCSFFFLQMGLITLICMLGYVACFAISWGPVTWVLLSEIFPNQIRGRAMALAVAVMWISNYLVSWTFPIMDKSSFLTTHFHNGFSFWMYGLISLLAAWFVWKKIPETKGKSLEEISNFWTK